MVNTRAKNQGNRGGSCISGVSVLQKVTLKGEFRVQHKLGSNERALNFQKNAPSLTFIRQLVLEISRLKVKNMDVAIFLILSLIFG